jgi:HEAT repeat protein
MDTLDAEIAADDTDVTEHDEDVAARLVQFGDSAKKALLERLTDPNRTWRVFATSVLVHWPNLSDDDLPALIDTLKMDRTDFVFEVLAKIGSPTAVRFMIADIHRYGDRSEAVSAFRPETLPSLLPILADPDLWPTAADIIGKLRNNAADYAIPWASIATDRNTSHDIRIAALRGIAAMKESGRPAEALIVPLAHSDDEGIQNAAIDALQAMGAGHL